MSFSLVRFVGALGGASVLVVVLFIGASVTFLNTTASAPRGWYLAFPVRPTPVQRLADRAALALHPSWRQELVAVSRAPLLDAARDHHWYALGCPTSTTLRYAAAIAYAYTRERDFTNLCPQGFAPFVKPLAVQRGTVVLLGGKAWWHHRPLSWTHYLRSPLYRRALMRFAGWRSQRPRVYRATTTLFFVFSPVRDSFDSRYFGPALRFGYARELFS